MLVPARGWPGHANAIEPGQHHVQETRSKGVDTGTIERLPPVVRLLNREAGKIEVQAQHSRIAASSSTTSTVRRDVTWDMATFSPGGPKSGIA